MNKIERPRSIPSTTFIAALTFLTLMVMAGQVNQVQGQWTTNGNNINNTNSGNVGIGTTNPTSALTVQKDQNYYTSVSVFNTSDGADAQAGIGVARTTDYSDKYFVMGVTAPSFSNSLFPGFTDIAYLHSKGVPIRMGTQSAHDINFFTNGSANNRFTVASGGNIGVGTTAPNSRFVVKQSGDSFVGGFHLTRSATADTWSLVTGSDNVLYFGYANNASGANSASDFTAYPLALAASGADAVIVRGWLRLETLDSAGSNHLCLNTSNQVATCSSSLRYKKNVAPFSFGLNLVQRLRPIRFEWKDGGMKDVGFGAEDVAAVEPLLVTYNAKGEVEGVKYDRISAVLVNAVKEQQGQIEAQQQQLKQQQTVIDGLKKLLCQQNPTADICR
ncbi:MAG TPA: tail fiber domain-containing protein [Pyrinomonadaceae bacterium]